MNAPVVPLTRCRFCGTPSEGRATVCRTDACRNAYTREWRAQRRAVTPAKPPGPRPYEVAVKRAAEADALADRVEKLQRELMRLKRTESRLRALLHGMRTRAAKAKAKPTGLAALVEAAEAVLWESKGLPKGATGTSLARLEAAVRGTK